MEPPPLYNLEEPLTETVELLTRDGRHIVTVTCHEATGEQGLALGAISKIENNAVDAYLRSRGGELTFDVKRPDLKYWKFPKDVKFTVSENSFMNFRRKIFPKFVACSTFDLPRPPTAMEAWNFREENLNKWYKAAYTTNPSWFDEWREVTNKQVVRESAEGNGAKIYKKKSTKPPT